MSSPLILEPPSHRIRARRLEAMYSQVEMAAAFGVSPRTWQNWEAGSVTPRLCHRRALVAWLTQPPFVEHGTFGDHGTFNPKVTGSIPVRPDDGMAA